MKDYIISIIFTFLGIGGTIASLKKKIDNKENGSNVVINTSDNNQVEENKNQQ